MFGPQFAEGQTIHQGKPLHLKLPEDDAKAIETINPAFLERLAIASDKYDCTMAMSQWVSVQLTTMHRQYGYTSHPEHLLYSTYVFDEPYHFQQITKLMVCNRSNRNGTSDLSSSCYDIPETIQDMLPRHIISTIARKERELKKQFTNGLEAIIAPLLAKPLQNGLLAKKDNYSNISSHQSKVACQCDSERVFFFFEELLRCNLYPLTTAIDSQSLSELLVNLEKCTFGTPQKVYDTPVTMAEYSQCTPKFNTELQILKSKMTDAFTGFCLDCVLHGKPNDSKKFVCRIPHEGFLGLKED
ncbi:hypothetical protein MMC34_004160 [Xylographa carneopallida]|nr:hypothetical protein [Xylographa carneopallida]